MAKRTDSKVDRKRKLEELKRQQRAKERRKTILTLGIATVIGGLLLGGVVWAAVAENRKEERDRKKAAAEAQQKIDVAKAEIKTLGVTTAAASCSTVQADNPFPTDKDHVQGKVDYKSVPPTGGDHSQETLPIAAQNFYELGTGDELVENAVHDMEHGVVVAWYDKKLPTAEIEVLKKVAANTQTQQRRLLVMPWDRGDLPGDNHFVLTAWGQKQACGKVSGEVVQAFLEKFENQAALPERGLTVERG